MNHEDKIKARKSCSYKKIQLDSNNPHYRNPEYMQTDCGKNIYHPSKSWKFCPFCSERINWSGGK